jgi:hypothetical protein
MSPLFGNRDEEEKIKNLVEGAQKLSDQIVALQTQLNEKNTQLENMQKAQSQHSVQTSADAAKLKEAQAQAQALQRQLTQLQSQNSAQTSADAAKLKEAQAQVQALQRQVSELNSKQGAAPQAPPPAAGQSKQGSAPAGQSKAVGAGGLAVGVSAWVTRAGGLPLRLRSGPSLEGQILDRLAPGTQMTLLEGPRQADGHAWWHIRTTDNREGWVAGEELRTQPD